jgi:para-aminobenzoate synthetase/4-amino-4-deoxychorismate lyase
MSPVNKDVFVVFDFCNHGSDAQRLCFADPLKIIVANSLSEVRPALRAVEQATREGLFAAGYVSYEASPAFDPALVVQGGSRMPLLWFGIFREPTKASAEHRESKVDLRRTDSEFWLSDWRPSVSRELFCQKVSSIREAIAVGDTYQVNYTMRLRSHVEGDALAFYERLRSAQRSHYCAYFDAGAYRILSASPELFFRRTGNQIVMRPMKGTAARGRWTEEDDRLRAQLAASEKEQAENVMIVDLVRNDLGRVAEIGSVRVPSLILNVILQSSR